MLIADLFDRSLMPRSILAVSPHLDDAVLSAGATIAELTDGGATVVVRTAFAGVPTPPFSETAEGFHELWGLRDNVVLARHAEDAAALAHVGAHPEHGNALDAIYRQDAHGAWLISPWQENRDRHLTAHEPDLEAALLDGVLASIHFHRPDVVFTAAAVGAHIDHVRARNAAIAAATIEGLPVFLWEDMPYGVGAPTVTSPPDLPEGVNVSAPEDHVVGGEFWRRKLEAIELYPSQLTMLAAGGAPVVEQIDALRRLEGDPDARVERFWSGRSR